MASLLIGATMPIFALLFSKLYGVRTLYTSWEILAKDNGSFYMFISSHSYFANVTELSVSYTEWEVNISRDFVINFFLFFRLTESISFTLKLLYTNSVVLFLFYKLNLSML